MKVEVATHVAAPLPAVWKAYVTPEDIKRWNAASDDWHTVSSVVDLRPGGTFSSRMEAKDGSQGFDFAGTYVNVVDEELIEYEFGGRRARVIFSPDSGGVNVQVTFDPEDTYPIEQQRGGWQSILNNFSRYVESKAR